ncbi:uncharacterized protein BO96DRAFT_430043 [Aspergillus niger CBS 101883]|uniref:uncharacterized protein n=1 Tax=Aspergillus lacticoffeatus (strain CBS 101883) TaxID=1450533 RepID=UPI000D7F5D92|nr:uncharacterized protein BO96DRAFT_430043 [Aspergillus niger CBS 101883]PYH61449.1 hypothetical protein BO96DRAFT_430043 [Aspergillus niger CBS 101883]
MSSFLATLLQSTFPLDGPINTDGDYTGTSRPFSSSTGFSMDEEENIRRGGAVGHPLAQPVSIPATNGLRYNTQQPAMQEVPFPTSPTSILMSPTDTCSGSFSFISRHSHHRLICALHHYGAVFYRNILSFVDLTVYAFFRNVIR